MQSGIWKHIAGAAAIAVLLYAGAYWGIEHRRTRNGPWELTFSLSERGEPTVQVDQPQLGVQATRLIFIGVQAPTNFAPQKVRLSQPQDVPFDLAFGRCIYQDLTFLPGVVTCNFFGYEVEFMPRTLVVDKREIAWKPNEVLRIGGEEPKKRLNPN